MFKGLTRGQLRFLWIFFVLGLILRLALVMYVSPFPERYIQADAVGYNQLAINVLAGHGFSQVARAPYLPDNFRTPGYPLTIAAIYALFGYHPDYVLLLQVLLGTLTILFAYFIAKQLGNNTTGLIAAALVAISPHSITYSALLWSDTAYTFVFIVSFLFCVLILVKTNIKWTIIGAVLSGLAVLIHPRTIYMAWVFAFLLMVVMLLAKKPAKQILVHFGTFVLLFNLVLLPWRYRNYSVFGVLNISSASGINMLDYGAALTESARTGENQWTIAQRYDAEVRAASPSPLNEAQFSEAAFRLGVIKIIGAPLTYAKIHAIGMARILLPGTSQICTLITGASSLDTTAIYAMFTTNRSVQDSAQSLFESSVFVLSYIAFEAIYLCFIYSFTLYALAKHHCSLPLLWLILMTLFYLALVAGPAGAPRFRVVMMPLLCILAASGVASINWVSRKMDWL
jgi:hypothetical protein